VTRRGKDMKNVVTTALLAVLMGHICAQERTTCYKPDSDTTICEFSDGRASVTVFDGNTGYYSHDLYTAEEWRDSLYRKSVECKAMLWNWNGSSCSKPVQSPAEAAASQRQIYTGPQEPIYTGPKTKHECNAAGYQWKENHCTGEKTKQACKAAGGKWQYGTCSR